MIMCDRHRIYQNEKRRRDRLIGIYVRERSYCSIFVKGVNMQRYMYERGVTMIVNDLGNCGCVKCYWDYLVKLCFCGALLLFASK